MKYEDVIESLSQQVYELGGEEGLLVIPAEASKRQIKRAEKELGIEIQWAK